MREAVWSVSLVAAAMIAVLFARQWKRTGDRFFAFFSAAFCALGATNVLQLVLDTEGEGTSAIYLARLAGFLLIIGAILEKNRSRQTRSVRPPASVTSTTL